MLTLGVKKKQNKKKNSWFVYLGKGKTTWQRGRNQQIDPGIRGETQKEPKTKR